MNFLDRIFKLKDNQTSVRTELIGGVTTFMTMSYIIFLQPAILSSTGMDPGVGADQVEKLGPSVGTSPYY